MQEGRYCLVFEEVDESEVDIVRFSATALTEADEEMRFPRAGKANAKSTLRMIDFTLSAE